MSIDTTIFLGTFLECTTSTVEQTEKIKSCSNKDCKNYNTASWRFSNPEDKFCSLCGNEIAERNIIKETVNVDAYEARMAIDEALYNVPGDSFHTWSKNNNIEVWLPNRRIHEARKFSFDPDHEDYPPMTPGSPEMMAVEMMQFSEAFHKEIEYLRSQYGRNNVVIRWGLIHYSC